MNTSDWNRYFNHMSSLSFKKSLFLFFGGLEINADNWRRLADNQILSVVAKTVCNVFILNQTAFFIISKVFKGKVCFLFETSNFHDTKIRMFSAVHKQ